MYTLLLVDDEEEVTRIIAKKVKWNDLGFSVTGHANNGLKALEMLEEILSFFKSISLEILGDIIILNDKNIASFLYTEKISLLNALLEERAKRLMKRDSKLTFLQAKKELETIDLKNKASKDFIEPKDAIRIDTTNLSLEEVYEKILLLIPN